MTTLVFVRHGQSQANADGIIAAAHSPLTQKGIDQARKTAEDVRALGIDMIVCSSYLRAQQTAETIAGELGIDLAHVKVIEALNERGLGELEGEPKSHESMWYYTGNDARDVETTEELLVRMSECMTTLKELGENHTVLAVGHSISGFYLLQAAGWQDFPRIFRLARRIT